MLVSCICPTAGRRSFLPLAIECFRAQTYGPRELLIFQDGPESIADLVPHEDPRIRLIVSGWTAQVGVKRNMLCDAARGEWIAHWDDDDWSDPRRLARQILKLRETGKQVAGYHSMKFTDGARWWQFEYGASHALGTSLVYAKEWWRTHPFAALRFGEDSLFAEQAVKQRAHVFEPDQHLMYATVHAGNTCPRAVRSAGWSELGTGKWVAGIGFVKAA